MDCDTAATDASIPSCESCRRRKLKCGRQQPTCTNCGNFQVDCVYNFDRKKPGLKIGAIESLSRRLELVEAALPRQAGSSPSREGLNRDRSTVQEVDRHRQESHLTALSSLTRELHDLTNAIVSVQSHVAHPFTIGDATSTLRPPRKKRRIQSDECASTYLDPHEHANASSIISNMDARHNEQVVDAYFHCIQPWLSIVHDPSFRRHFQEKRLSRSTDVVFQAMLVATLPYVEQATIPDSTTSWHVEEARGTVISNALNTTCIENIQALLILTYADVVGGNLRRAMSVLGIITSQLTMLGSHRERTGGKNDGPIDTSLRIVDLDWISDEEERRVIWNVQILGRLCSALTGCNESFSATMSSRRLPACASFWYTNRKIATPFLQAWDSAGHSHLGVGGGFPISVPSSGNSEPDGTAWKGSLAFFIETVEMMGAVLAHLRQPVVYGDRNDVWRWLKSFRDLDEQLMHWKTGVPQQWTDSGISRYVLPGVMDPVMTEANALYNANVILLHERIAYPEPELQIVQLPSAESARICRNAALEVHGIICKFLRQQKEDYPVGPYFGICAFVSARNLLMYSQGQSEPIAPEFWQFIDTLETMAQRFKCHTTGEYGQVDLFSKLAGRLKTLHARAKDNSTFRINIAAPLLEPLVRNIERRERHWLSQEAVIHLLEHSRKDVNLQVSHVPQLARTSDPSGSMLPSTAESITGQGDQSFLTPQDERRCHPGQYWSALQEQQLPCSLLNSDDLVAISQSLIDPSFTGLDRVLNLEELLSSGISEGVVGWQTS